MTDAVKFVAACEALAEVFERAGRIDLATLCDRAAYWLEGGPRVEALTLEQVISACHETLMTESYAADAIAMHARQNVRRIERAIERALADSKPERSIELAARLQAVAILTEKLF